ncbi:hypothetical protein [Methyloterricola oryzae]|uniref:hypothetical protein n=1 Tax=Methyloterricola oryzae TaxID=1495050 RepID=UPI0005EBB45F|nr:hypothetical protein [Methyloterricola oryzae]
MSSSVHCSPQTDCEEQAQQLNRDCHCVTFDRARMREELLELPDGKALFRMIVEERPHLFADSPVFIPQACLQRQALIIQAIERVVALPAYQDRVLAYAPVTARTLTRARGVFFGYDFHLSASGPQLIEINTNAGGALINALLMRAQLDCGTGSVHAQATRPSAPDRAEERALDQTYLEMFQTEWRLEHPERPLGSVAIVDDDPANQFLYPEFLLFKALFERQGIAAVICGPQELQFDGQRLRAGGQDIDLVYNRLTDFGLEAPALAPLREAYQAGAAVVTPHPRAHALYADKRNLGLLSDAAALQALGVDEDTRSLLTSGIAHTETVDPARADELWASRKRLFFKPAAGYGSKAAYRGDKLTRRVFEEILRGQYVAQHLIPPSERHLQMDGAAIDLKVDLRNYVYRGEVQAVTTRLYQGQTTNFRTPGGGFAPVVVIPCIDEQLKASAGCL